MNRSTEIEIKVGIFVTLGLGLIMFTILILGGGQTLFQRSSTFTTTFAHIEGLVEGATVKMAGVKIGQVSNIRLLKDNGQVRVTFNIASKFIDAIHQDSTVGIETQGVLGDRYLVISAGTSNSTLATENSELKSEAPRELKDYLNNADEVLGRLKNSLTYIESVLGSFHREHRAEYFFKNMTAVSTNANESTRALKDSMGHLKSIIGKVDNGHGTLGALINDPSLYDDMKALLGGANRNRVLKYFIRKSVEESRDAARDQQQEKK